MSRSEATAGRNVTPIRDGRIDRAAHSEDAPIAHSPPPQSIRSGAWRR